MITGQFFSWRGTLWAIGLTLIAIRLLPLIDPGFPGNALVDALCFVFTIGVLALVGAAVRQRDLEEIQARTHALTQAHDELATRVQQRTAELAQANIALQAEIAERIQIGEVLNESDERFEVFIKELGQRNRETALLIEMGESFQACRTAEEAYAVIRQSLPRLFPCGSGALYMLDASRDLLEAIAFWGAPPVRLRKFQRDACWALRHGKMHQVEESAATLVCQHLEDSHHAASLCLPLLAQGDTVGVLTLTSSGPAEHGAQPRFNESKQQLAVTAGEHIALALANLKLQETLRYQAIRDPLTNLFNRRYMEETVERELSRVKRKDAPLGIVMLDIDHFKRFNDTFGHAAGDSVLRELGRFLQTHMRGEDIACRFGGEEFTLIMPEASLGVVQRRAEEIRSATRGLNVQHRDQVVGSITLSMGVASFPDHGATIEELFRIADAALYRAKAEGRDRILIGTESQK